MRASDIIPLSPNPLEEYVYEALQKPLFDHIHKLMKEAGIEVDKQEG